MFSFALRVKSVYYWFMLRFDNIALWPRTMIIAHRGAGHAGTTPSIRENTIDAFEAAIAAGADAIELDLRRTRNGVIIVHHDAKVPGMQWSIGESPDDSVTEGALKAGYKIPTFEETLECCAGKISLDIELKETGYEQEVFDLTRKYYDPAHVCFTSFHDNAIRRIREDNHQAITGLLLGDEPPAGARQRISELFPKKKIEISAPDFVAPNWRFLRWGRHDNRTYGDLPIITWTVDDPKLAEKLIDHRIAGIITNIPDVFLPLAAT